MRWFLNGYPYGRFCTEIVTWCYQFLYLIGRSNYYSPWLHLMNLQIFSISPDELVKQVLLSKERTTLILEKGRKDADSEAADGVEEYSRSCFE